MLEYLVEYLAGGSAMAANRPAAAAAAARVSASPIPTRARDGAKYLDRMNVS